MKLYTQFFDKDFQSGRVKSIIQDSLIFSLDIKDEWLNAFYIKVLHNIRFKEQEIQYTQTSINTFEQKKQL